MREEYRVQEDDYSRYVDKTPFLIYLSISLVMLPASALVWPQLLIYATIPVVMTNLVGSPKQDRFLVSVMNFAFAFLVSMYFRNNKVLG